MLRMALCRISSAALVAAALFCAGCSTAGKQAAPPAPAPATAKRAPVIESSSIKMPPPIFEPPRVPVARTAAAHTALNEGIELYDRGDFDGAIRRLNAAELRSADKSVRTRALKYMAFSYCVTSRQVLCRRQFEKALKIDPSFDLDPGEQGHPLWGSVFARAKEGR